MTLLISILHKDVKLSEILYKVVRVILRVKIALIIVFKIPQILTNHTPIYGS